MSLRKPTNIDTENPNDEEGAIINQVLSGYIGGKQDHWKLHNATCLVSKESFICEIRASTRPQCVWED